MAQKKDQEEVKKPKGVAAPEVKLITAFGCEIKPASIASLNKGEEIAEEMVIIMLTTMIKALPSK